MLKRIRQINFKVSDEEREILNELIMQKKCSMSDLIRAALKCCYSTEGFEPSYTETASKAYEDKWRVY